MTVVRLKEPYRHRHPWIFSRSVAKPEERIPPGSVVDVQQPDGALLGRGFYNGHARIGVRLLTTDPAEAVDQGFFERRLARAVAWRRQLGMLGPAAGVRLVNSEGDGMSGLIADQFAEVLALQFTAAGMFRWREPLKAELMRLTGATRCYWFAEERVQKQESFDCWAVPPPPPTVIAEHGLRFHVAVGTKHKTGFFADQRANRRRLGDLVRGLGGARVADLCCHTGGFALSAKVRGGAATVVGVDLDDAEALPTARANAELNGAGVTFVAADVYDWCRAAVAGSERYDVVILDPAKQTRSAEGVKAALDQYAAMNRLAAQTLAPGGVLVTCSCSGLISEEQFLGAVRRGVAGAGRELQVFDLSGADADHPFLADVPEGRYLKVVWGRVV